MQICVSVRAAGTMGNNPHMWWQLYATWECLCMVDGESGNMHKQAINLCQPELTSMSAADFSEATTSRGNEVDRRWG